MSSLKFLILKQNLVYYQFEKICSCVVIFSLWILLFPGITHGFPMHGFAYVGRRWLNTVCILLEDKKKIYIFESLLK